jgi:sirohydrochlorin cobaltochelatase
MTMPKGLILFGHGARDPRWAEPFEAVAARVRALQPEVAVRLAYLEFMSPSLPEAGDALAQAGCTEVAVQPMFLGTGGHVRRDLPELIDALRARHPATRWTLHTAIGETAPVMDAMAQVAASTIVAR